MNVCIFDDESMAINFLSHQLKKIDDVKIRFTSTTPYIGDYMKVLEEVDVVFLDIEMPEVDGLALAEQLNEKHPHLHIVFVSAYKGYAVEAFELSALDYLLKPVKRERLEKTIHRIKQKLTLRPEKPINTKKALHICTFGQLKFWLDEEDITDTIQWRTNKSKEVFLFLLHHSGNVISKDKIVDTIWPDATPEKGFANLYVNIYNIRKSLKHLDEFIFIASTEDGYVLKLSKANVDKQTWYDYFKNAEALNQETLSRYTTFLNLYKGRYLEGYDYIWAESVRFEMEEIWLKHAKALADFHYQEGNVEQASRFYTSIIKCRPDNEQIAFRLMKLYARFNYRMLVEHQYKDLKQHLNELDVEVDPDIQSWFLKWQTNYKI
ncbi:Two-component response regulator, SAPR family, consists of REC, wHTH and BTAD domains [Pelagirhabdus alkalitolerans]|uniref:Two-component response regulator, SAPR family, consists of REC, wHTH and BTAD domains n=1 Tax=Pelagirhabdus alkalitolerans TaxID=1612202 RepID=A0A1G6GRG1_9BACI|nr:response regulator [Pelagirhabdus alkalitolerans]SDB84325.1 Two-component response regulator, SAPR family, consists of REC, wHTH and BTAD domains [Pelagirhabdus alkalitolerans]